MLTIVALCVCVCVLQHKGMSHIKFTGFARTSDRMQQMTIKSNEIP